MSEKPTAAFVLSLIGWIFILLGGAAIAALGSILSGMVGSFGAAGGADIVTLYGIIGVINGLLVIIFGVLLYMQPQRHVAWGVLVLVLSIASWLTTIGGFFIGFILALIGGILGIAWKPPAPMAPGMAPPMMPPSMPPT